MPYKDAEKRREYSRKCQAERRRTPGFKAADAARDRRRRAMNPWRRTEVRIRAKVGTGLALKEKQNNKCAICGVPPEHVRNKNIKNLSLDHCHLSGKVRGLLCATCNTSIGALGDTSETIQMVLNYLGEQDD